MYICQLFIYVNHCCDFTLMQIIGKNLFTILFWLTHFRLAELLIAVRMRMRMNALSASMCAPPRIPGSGWLSDIAAPSSRH